MNYLKRMKQYLDHPSYSMMRLFARFEIFRVLAPNIIKMLKIRQPAVARTISSSTVFPNIDEHRIIQDLKKTGVSFGIKLPKDIVEGIRQYAESACCYADRKLDKGFYVREHAEASKKLNKEILVAQYFNSAHECREIGQLVNDPMLHKVAKGYLGENSRFVGVNLWWTFPVNASDEDRYRHAHKFHRDVDDFRFFKFFFYLTDVEIGDGGHVVVKNSKGKPPTRTLLDRWNIRRYSDDEITSHYPVEDIVEVAGLAGDGFAEDTWSIHKGKTPKKSARLLLQFQFSLNDFGVVSDERDPSQLRMIN
ncbi:hypothetical protein [Marinobacterium sp. xm-d-564]|uniref:hypothetical protein n=1 Tax=Marinobacterium sp. xm-d-564 TaxID=2497742 RepID=UPI0015693FDB|nr:hypothetical protein [Marinobacterium sp. xm-d-564]NRP60359.1 hypothetical protein [Marinobacterium sp. xm-d-564]